MSRKTGQTLLITSALLCFGLSTVIPNSTAKMGVARTQLEPKEFDRLDARGPSGKKVDVIEWENNLEIHVYPKGSLRSLGLKVDRTNKDKPVMVIEYGFHGVPYTLIRRAVLGIPMKDGFKTYQDTSTSDYDKIMISNNTLNDGVRPYALAAEPTQLYPDYHPSLADDSNSPSTTTADEPAKRYQRKSASDGATPEMSAPKIQFRKAEELEQGTSRKRAPLNEDGDEDGRIRNFAF